jgi:monoamine oxidase
MAANPCFGGPYLDMSSSSAKLVIAAAAVAAAAAYACYVWYTETSRRAQGHVSGSCSGRRAIRAVASQWKTNPHIRSAYSALRPGGTPQARLDLSALPQERPGLHMAGEATAVGFVGTMHGAWLSGERVAAEILVASTPPSSTVVVVGAGLAGLSCATALAPHVAQVWVCEANAVPGGRATADTSLGFPAHLGAAWVHGDADTNPLARMARAWGVPLEIYIDPDIQPELAHEHPDHSADATLAADRVFVAGDGELSAEHIARLEPVRQRVEKAIEQAAAADVVCLSR